MPSRPRTHVGGDEPPDGDGAPTHHNTADMVGGHHSVAAAQRAAIQVAHRGRAGNSAPTSGATPGSPASHDVALAGSPDEVELARRMDKYRQLGDAPPKVNVEANDAAHATEGAHTVDRHGPDVPLPRAPGTKTIEGRIYGDDGWPKPESRSYRWIDHSVMNRTVNEYIQGNWETIRSDLAMDDVHVAVVDAHRQIGEGYYNKGMYGAGPRQAQYSTTSVWQIRIRLVTGSDPAELFVVTAFPYLPLG